ncbi:MAG: hypothetical protein ACJ71F_16240 [Nitrososphaeraceae archaeon]
MMGQFGLEFMGIEPFFPFFSSIVLISGIVVIIGAILLSKRPQEATICGIIVLVFSIVSLVGMRLSILGSIIRMIGGVIVLSNNKQFCQIHFKK